MKVSFKSINKINYLGDILYLLKTIINLTRMDFKIKSNSLSPHREDKINNNYFELNKPFDCDIVYYFDENENGGW